MIYKSGFYISQGIKWIDEHAGHKFEGITYNFLYLRKDSYFVKLSDNNLDFNIIEFLRTKTDEILSKDTSITFGKFKINEKGMDLNYTIWGENRVLNFIILTPSVLLDKDLREYHFKYVVGIEFEAKGLDAAIKIGDDMWVASNPMEIGLLFKKLDKVPIEQLNTPQKLSSYLINLKDPDVLGQITGFGNEVKLLSENGFIFNSSSKMFIRNSI